MKPIFDSEAENWNSLYTEARRGRYAIFQSHARRRTERRLALCLKLLAPKAGMTVLDLGCGSGMFRKPVEQSGARWVGVDLSYNMLAHNRKLNGNSNKEFGLVNGCASALPFAAAFDAVLCVGVVNFHRPAAVSGLMQEVARVLKPGGILILTSVRLDVLTWVRSRLYPRVPLPFSSPGPIYPLHYRKVLRLFKELPFACEEMQHVAKYLGLPHYTLFRFRRERNGCRPRKCMRSQP